MIAKSCLLYHPDTSNEAIKQLHIGVKASFSEGYLRLHYDLLGEVDVLLVPESRPPSETDCLWQHTCFEAFISVLEETHYHEFNFSPSGQWAAYAFKDYRKPKEWRASVAPALTYVRVEDRLSMEAVINAKDLPDNPFAKPYRLGLAAVLETQDVELSYWSLCHPAGKPDFHHRCGLTLSF